MTTGQSDEKPIASNVSGHATAGNDAQTGRPSRSSDEATAPDLSTDKKADDTKPA